MTAYGEIEKIQPPSQIYMNAATSIFNSVWASNPLKRLIPAKSLTYPETCTWSVGDVVASVETANDVWSANFVMQKDQT